MHFGLIRNFTEKYPLLSKPAMHRALIENLHSGILMEDEDRLIIVANQTFCDMFDIPLTPDELIGKDFLQVSEFIKKASKNAQKTGAEEKALIEKRKVNKAEALELNNGNSYKREYIPIYTTTGYIGSLWKYTDNTEQHKIKNDLQKNERKYKSIIDTMNLGLLEVDNEGYIQTCNDSFREMLSYQSINDLIGKQASETLLDDEARQVMKEQIALREKGVSGAYEIKIKKANGVDSAWVLISGTALFDDDNNVIGSIGIHLDITQQKMLSQKVQEARAIEGRLEAQEKAMELLEEKVAERTNEIVSQKKIIEKKNYEITQSLNYALRIQQALLPDKKKILETLPESFILFKPKDIVSGDFYFYTKRNNHIIIAAADCTGHGVPGAFMSMLGSEKLSDAVQKDVTPGEALSLLDKGIKDSLCHSENERSVLDGLDIALCFIDVDHRIIQFAGARRPIWIIRKSAHKLEEIKGTKRDIGGWASDDQLFDTHQIPFEKGDSFYIFTDGYSDQHNESNKRFMTRRLRQHLLAIQHLTMQEQEASLKALFENWQGYQEQTDDILVIGVRL